MDYAYGYIDEYKKVSFVYGFYTRFLFYFILFFFLELTYEIEVRLTFSILRKKSNLSF